MRERIPAALGSLLAFASLLGCTSGPTRTYYRDVKPIVDRKCISCHFKDGIAPFPLDTYADLYRERNNIRDVVTARIMPPWLAGRGCTEYLADRSLSEAQIATIAGWVLEGAVAGNPAAEGQPLPIDDPGLTRIDSTLAMPEAYTAQEWPDDYRCFVLPWPETTFTNVTGFRAIPGQPTIVHHVIAFLAPPDRVATYEALDAAEAGPGYTCFGGPGGGGGDSRTLWLGAWAPGGRGSDYPAGTGLAVEPGSAVILQVHYNTLEVAAVPDQTAVEFKLDATVTRQAFMMPWANPGWITANTMIIPAGASDVVHSFSLDPTSFLSPPGAFLLHAAALHMHLLGTRGHLVIDRAGGSRECLLDVPRWDFHWQQSYGFVEPKRFDPGDRLTIECHWDNSTDNQPLVGGIPRTPQEVRWGEGTRDEMCLGLLYVSEL